MLKCWSRSGKGDSGRAQRGRCAEESVLVYNQGRAQSRSWGGASGRGRAGASKWGWVLGARGGCAGRAAVTFAVKTPCFGEQGKGTGRKPGRADVRTLQRSLFLAEETVAFRARH